MGVDFAHMNVFFIVTTVTVIVVGVLLAIVLVRVFGILGDVKHVSENISEESDEMRADVSKVRGKITKTIRTLFGRSPKKKRK